jgi:hypothetical protein
MSNDSFEPSLGHLQESLWSWAAQADPTSELFKTLFAWCQVIDAIGDDIDTLWQSRCIATATQDDLIAQYGYVYGLDQEQLPPTLGQLRDYIQAIVAEDGTVASLVREIEALIGVTAIVGCPIATFPANGSGLVFPGGTGLVFLGAGEIDFPATGGLTFGAQPLGITLCQFTTPPQAGLIFPPDGSGLHFAVLPGIGSNPVQAEAMDGTIGATQVGSGAGTLPITFANDPYITVTQNYPTFVVQVPSYLPYDRGALARAVQRFQPAHLLPGIIDEI